MTLININMNTLSSDASTENLAYAHRLKALADEVSDALLIVKRVYFEKPRTTVG